MNGWDDLHGALGRVGRLCDRFIGWVIVLAVVGGAVTLAVFASRLAGG